MANSFKFFNVPEQVAAEYPVPGIGKVSQFNVLFFIFMCGQVYFLYWLGLPFFIFLALSFCIVIPEFSLMVFIANFHSHDIEKNLPDLTQAIVIRGNLKNDIIRTCPDFSLGKTSRKKKNQDFTRFLCFASGDHTCAIHQTKTMKKKNEKPKNTAKKIPAQLKNTTQLKNQDSKSVSSTKPQSTLPKTQVVKSTTKNNLAQKNPSNNNTRKQ